MRVNDVDDEISANHLTRHLYTFAGIRVYCYQINTRSPLNAQQRRGPDWKLDRIGNRQHGIQEWHSFIYIDV